MTTPLLTLDEIARLSHRPPDSPIQNGIVLSVSERDALLATARAYWETKTKFDEAMEILTQWGNVDHAVVVAENARLRAVVDDVRTHARLGDHSHWDAQGNFGRTCPVCMEQIALAERIRAALRATETP